MDLDKIKEPEILIPGVLAAAGAGMIFYLHKRLTTLEERIDEIEKDQNNLRNQIVNMKGSEKNLLNQMRREIDTKISDLKIVEDEVSDEDIIKMARLGNSSRVKLDTSQSV